MVAISRDIACLWPPESLLTPAFRRPSRPMPRRESCVRMTSRRRFVTPRRRPLRLERSSEMARFSSMVIEGAVPARGSWKTRPIMRLRTCSACFVTSRPPITILPALKWKVPATPFRSVDLPDPLEPMMVTNWPGRHLEVDAVQGDDLVGGAGKEDLAQPAYFQRGRGAHSRTTLRRTVGMDSAATTSAAVSSLRSVGCDAKAKADRDQESVHDGPADHAEQHPADAAHAEDHLAHDDAGKTGDDRADAHADVGEALLLRHQRAGERHEAVGDGEADDPREVRVGANGADHLLVVAGGQQREPELGVQQPVEDVLDDDGERHKHEHEVPADHGQRQERADLVEDDLHAQQRDVAASHDAQVDRVEGRHRQDPGEQLGPVVGGVALPGLEKEMQEPGDEAGAQTRADRRPRWPRAASGRRRSGHR